MFEQAHPYRHKIDYWFPRAGGHGECGVSFGGSASVLKWIMVMDV